MYRISHLLCLTPQLGSLLAPPPPPPRRYTLHICGEDAIFALEILLSSHRTGETHDTVTVDDKEAAEGRKELRKEGRKPSLAENDVGHVVIRRS